MAKKTKRKLHNCTCETCERHSHSKIAKEHKAINRVLLGLDERNRRRFIGMLASQRGNISELSQITGLSRNTIYRGQREVEHPRRNPASGVRRPGGGRMAVEKNNPSS
jgi:transcriptional regulator of acetoin/glycerol metabolism